MKVLIADDHEIVRIGLKQLLGRATIIEATDADSAFKLFKKHKPDVTVIETRIAGDGLACLSRIKLEQPDAPVLMLSGHDNPTYIARAVALGAKDTSSRRQRQKTFLLPSNQRLPVRTFGPVTACDGSPDHWHRRMA